MDLDSMEGLDEVRLAVNPNPNPAVYRAALKLRSLQKLCLMHVVTLKEVLPALRLLSGGGAQLTKQEVMLCINRMFQSVSEELSGQVASEAPEQICRLLYRLYDREQTGSICVRALEAVLIVLSADTLSAKHRALACLAERSSRGESSSVSRNGLRVLLEDLSQVPAAVQESSVFGSVETAVRSCFNGVLGPCVCEDQLVSWLQSGPCLLLWLSILDRLSASEALRHPTRCHACNTHPITGLRYRCMKCVNLHLCQTCFLTERYTKKHKSSHPVQEHCTQPSWRESLASLAHNARHALLPRRYTRSGFQRRSLTQSRAPSPDPPQLAASPVCQESVSSDNHSYPQAHILSPVPPLPPSPPPPPVSLQSKALQTEEETQCPQRGSSVLLKDVRDLQRDKWLLERQMQVLRVALQAEQGCLEDRCSLMEAEMEKLRQQNLKLQDMLSQTDTRPHATCSPTHMPQADYPAGTGGLPPLSDPGHEETEHEEVEEEEEQEEVEEEEEQVEEEEEQEEVEEEEEQVEEEKEQEEVEEEEEQEEEEVEEEEEQEEQRGGGEVREVDRMHDEATVREESDELEGRVGGRVPKTSFPTILKVLNPPHPPQHQAEQERAHLADRKQSYPIGHLHFLEEEHSGSCGSVEEQLCDLVQRLKTSLSLPTHTHTESRTSGKLLETAAGVADAVSQLVSTISTNIPF